MTWFDIVNGESGPKFLQESLLSRPLAKPAFCSVANICGRTMAARPQFTELGGVPRGWGGTDSVSQLERAERRTHTHKVP